MLSAVRTVGLALGVATVGGVMLLPGASHATTEQTGDTLSSSARQLPECGVGDLSVTYHRGDAAMSHRYGRLVFTNSGDRTCRTGGYAGLSYVGHGDGTQVGAPATRDASANRPRSLVLIPGAHARAQVSETVAQVYPRGRCELTHVDGFRVYPPNSTKAEYVVHPTTGCANGRVKLLSVRPLY